MNKKNIFKFFCLFLFLLLMLFGSFKMLNTAKAESEQEPVEIAYVTDFNYVTYIRTSIRSVIDNKKPETKIKIHVVGYKLSDEDIEKIKNEAVDDVKIDLILISKDQIKQFEGGSRGNPGVTRVDNAKFLLTSLLKDTKRVIYLDGDTIVLKDLSDLYFTDLKGNYVGVVDDWQSFWLGKPKRRYFNNGVMLLDLQKMREDGIEAKLTDYKRKDKIRRFVTQDAYNIVLYGKVQYLPLIYDTFAPEFDDEENLLSRIKETLRENYNPELYPYKTAKEYQNNVVVIHYCGFGNAKPWDDINFNRKSSRIWYKYAPLDFWENLEEFDEEKNVQ